MIVDTYLHMFLNIVLIDLSIYSANSSLYVVIGGQDKVRYCCQCIVLFNDVFCALFCLKAVFFKIMYCGLEVVNGERTGGQTHG